MIIFYFSGTGNTEFVAKEFAKEMGCDAYSIEEQINFKTLLVKHDEIVICYPIYGSRLPRNMRQFISDYQQELFGKKLVILCTQWLFSGDGARVLTDLLPDGWAEVIYADHFLMPNNVSNFFLLPPAPKWAKPLKHRAAKRKIKRIATDIRLKRVKKKGFSKFSMFLGKIQGRPWQKDSRSAQLVAGSVEEKLAKSVTVHQNCTACATCVRKCPVENLRVEDGRLLHRSNCIGCYRCVNLCPHRAISVMFKARPLWQYQGDYDCVG